MRLTVQANAPHIVLCAHLNGCIAPVSERYLSLALLYYSQSPVLYPSMATETLVLDLLLEEVSREGQKVSSFLNAQSYYQPSFRPGGLGEYPSDLPDDIQQARQHLRNAAKAVYQLAAGPAEYVKELASNVC
jgi:coenzyme F420-reducing hydrogenase alpha subunit